MDKKRIPKEGINGGPTRYIFKHAFRIPSNRSLYDLLTVIEKFKRARRDYRAIVDNYGNETSNYLSLINHLSDIKEMIFEQGIDKDVNSLESHDEKFMDMISKEDIAANSNNLNSNNPNLAANYAGGEILHGTNILLQDHQKY